MLSPFASSRWLISGLASSFFNSCSDIRPLIWHCYDYYSAHHFGGQLFCRNAKINLAQSGDAPQEIMVRQSNTVLQSGIGDPT